MGSPKPRAISAIQRMEPWRKRLEGNTQNSIGCFVWMVVPILVCSFSSDFANFSSSSPCKIEMSEINCRWMTGRWKRVLSLFPNSVFSRCPETCPLGYTSSVRVPYQGGLLCFTSHPGVHKAHLRLQRSHLSFSSGPEVKTPPACKFNPCSRNIPYAAGMLGLGHTTTKYPSLCSATRSPSNEEVRAQQLEAGPAVLN